MMQSGFIITDYREQGESPKTRLAYWEIGGGCITENSLSPENVECAVKASIVLHNMLCGELEVGAHGADVEAMETDMHDGVLRPFRREGHRPRDAAIKVREQFKNYFVSPAGAVTWQMEECFGHAN